MSRIDLPGADWSLLLTPRFAGLGTPGQEIALGLLVAVPVLLLLWLYRYELKLVRRLPACVLLPLRLMLIVLLWFLVGWQPILARTEVEEVPGAVVVAVDLSGSMGTTDPQRTPLEKLLLARSLKLTPSSGLASDELLDAWIKHYQRHGEDTPPAWDGPVQQQLHDQICLAVDRLTRAQIVEKIIAPDSMDLLRRLAKKHKVHLLGFGESAWDIDLKVGVPEPSSADHLTDLDAPLGRALELASQEKSKMLGLLLLTDGRHNTGLDPGAKAAELKDRGIPIYPVSIGGKKPPPDVAIIKVTAPTNLLLKTPAQLSTEIKVTNIPAGDIRVELHQPGEAKPKEQIVKHKGGAAKTYTVDFPLQADKVGAQQLTVKVKPVSAHVKEITEQNNSQTVAVRVVEDKARVLLVDGAIRWETHFLANALARDEGMTLEQVFFTQPNIGFIPKGQLKDAGHAATQLPAWDEKGKASDPLAHYQCILLGDVAPEHLPPADRTRLARFVTEGGTLVLLAGKEAMPLAYTTANAGGKEPDTLAKLLPVTQIRVIRPGDGFSVSLTPEGDRAAYLQMDETPAESVKSWAKLPRLYWGLIGRARPGATVLAYVKQDQTVLPALAADGKTPDPQRDNALLVMQNHGLGRVIYLGLDSTWRWRYRKGDYYHHRFWSQLILWAVSDQLLPAGNKYVRYGTRQPVYKAGDDVEILMRLEEAAPQLPAKAQVQARLILTKEQGKEETVAVVPLSGESSQRIFKGLAKNLPAGKYRIALDVPGLADQLKDIAPTAGTFVVLPPESLEQSELAVDWALLDNLARVSGAGPEALTPDRLDDLLNELEAQVTTHAQSEERRPWQDVPLTWWLLGAFLTLLTTEWMIRKMAALP